MGMGSGCGRPVLKRALGAAQIHGRSQDKLLRVGWGFGRGWVPSGQGLAACCQLPSSSTQFKHLLTLWILKNSLGQGYLPEKCWEVGIPLECFPKTYYFSEKVTNAHAGGDGKQFEKGIEGKKKSLSTRISPSASFFCIAGGWRLSWKVSTSWRALLPQDWHVCLVISSYFYAYSSCGLCSPWHADFFFHPPVGRDNIFRT